jgi:hypothetical protein
MIRCAIARHEGKAPGALKGGDRAFADWPLDRARPNELRERVKNAAMISALLSMANQR